MAVTQTKNDFSSNTETINNNTQYQQPQTEAPRQQPQQALSWMDLANTSLLKLGPNPQSEVVSAMKQSFQKFAESLPDKNISVDTIVLDRNNYTNLQYSVVVLTLQLKTVPGNPLAYYSYLITSTGEEIPVETRQFTTASTQETVEVMRLPSDANDPVLRKMVLDQVMAKVGKGTPVFEVSGSTIPRNFVIENKSEAEDTKLWNLFINGILACRKVLDFQYSTTDLSLVRASGDSTLAVQVERVDNDVTYDLTGLPCRSDVSVRMIARSKVENGSTLNRQNQKVISRAYGYVDFIWIGKPKVQNAWGAPVQPAAPSPIYQPCFVITNAMPEGIQSLTAQLMMLASTYVLVENKNWLIGVMPRKGLGKQNNSTLDEISAIGFDVNVDGQQPGQVGKRFNITPADFTMTKLRDFMDQVTHPGLLIGLTVPECGASTWQHADFAAAAEGVVEAQENIIQAMDYLTGGNFSKEWAKVPAQNRRICYLYGDRIHMGYYYDKGRQEYRDIHDLSYLPLLNMVNGKDMNQVRRYSDSFNNTEIPLDVRLSRRKQIYDILSPTYTGYGRMVIFSAYFMQAMVTAMAAANLHLKPEMPYAPESNDYRTPATFLQNATMVPTVSGLFTQASYNTYGNSPYNTGASTGYVSNGAGCPKL